MGITELVETVAVIVGLVVVEVLADVVVAVASAIAANSSVKIARDHEQVVFGHRLNCYVQSLVELALCLVSLVFGRSISADDSDCRVCVDRGHHESLDYLGERNEVLYSFSDVYADAADSSGSRCCSGKKAAFFYCSDFDIARHASAVLLDDD